MVEEKQENPLHAKEEGRAEGSSEETTGNGRSLGVFSFEGDIPLTQAVPLGLQHVLAMFVGNLTPLLIVTGVCGLATAEFAEIQLALLQNAMLIAGVVTLVQLFGIGPVGGRVPIIMGTSSGFIGVFNSVAASMGGGGCFAHRRFVRSRSGLLFKAASQILPVYRHGYRCAFHWLEPY